MVAVGASATGKPLWGPPIAALSLKFRSIERTNIDGDMMTMSTITPTPPITSPAGPAAPPFVDIYRMDIDEFERVADLLKAERVELIDGFIVERGAMDPPHVLSLAHQPDRPPGGGLLWSDSRQLFFVHPLQTRAVRPGRDRRR